MPGGGPLLQAFNCFEKFSRDHNCTTKGLYLMELDDDASLLGATELETDSSNDLEISLHGLTGIKTTDTMHLAASVADASLQALVDSQYTHSFIATSTACRLSLQPSPCRGQILQVCTLHHPWSALHRHFGCLGLL